MFLIDNFKVLTFVIITLVATIKLFQIISIVVTLFNAWKTGTILMTLAQWGLNTAMLANPIFWVIGAIVLLIGIIYLLITNTFGFRDAFVSVMIDIKDFFLNIWNFIANFFIQTWNNIKIAFQNDINSIKNFASNAWNFILNQLNGLKGGFIAVFTSIRDSVTSTFRGMVNNVISGVNVMISGLNRFKISVPSWIPVIGGNSWNGFNIPKIPMLANGGNILKSGSALVGENGPEILNLPRGASVTPLSKAGYTINIIEPKIFSTNDIDNLMNVITKRMKLANVGR
jgi:phage-related protein